MGFISFTRTKRSLTISIKIPLLCKYSGGGVAAFQEINGETCVLLGKRLNRPFARRWTFPGGGKEFGETLFKTAMREFREETGVTVLGRYIKRTGQLKLKKPFFRWLTVLVETSQPIHPTANPVTKTYGGEFSDLRWIPLKDLCLYNLHPFVKSAIRAYQKKGVMKKYTSKPPKKAPAKRAKAYSKSSSRSWVSTPEFAGMPKALPMNHRRVENDYTMRLVKVDKDGTKYFEPVYKNVVAHSGR